MKRIFTICSILFFLASAAHAQGIYQLWGATPRGGSNDAGAFFSARFDGTGQSVKNSFILTNPGIVEHFNKPVVFNNKLYTITSRGGIGDAGIIAEFDPANNTWTKKADLFSIGGENTEGHLTLYNNKLYGVTHTGGAGGTGLLFEYNPVNSGLTKLYDFVYATGAYPRGSLVVYNNKFYGSASGGPGEVGVVYQFDPATNTYSKKADLSDDVTGKFPASALVAFNGKLWGTTTYGALMNGGAIFSFDPATNQVSKGADLESIGLSVGSSCLTLFNNRLYGVVGGGGGNNFGGIFEFNPANNVLVKKLDNTFEGAHYNSEFTVFNNKLYASSSQGGTDSDGAIFSYDPINNVATVLKDLVPNGLKDGTGSVTVYNGKLYGFSRQGGDYKRGALFCYDPATAGFTIPVHLGGAQLINPTGAPLLYKNKIYGTAIRGGNAQLGGIYEYDPVTENFTIKAHFASITGGGSSDQQGGLTLYNNKFYGVLRYGGNGLDGILFEFDPATNTLVKKHDFNAATGNTPFGVLQEYNGKLYGTCNDGSAGSYGNIYEYDPATGIYAEKVILNQGWGYYSRSGLTRLNNKFYGVLVAGGANAVGTLYEYNPNGNVFMKKADFDGVNGAMPYGSLAAYDGKLYGISSRGGNTDSGTIYQFDPATSMITKRLDLDNATGDWAMNGMTLLNKKLYGMMGFGGASGKGCIFEWDPQTGAYAKKQDFNTVNGATPLANELSPIPAVTAPGSEGSCNNANFTVVNAANANEWIAFTDAEGRAVAEINANGNILGNVQVRFFINDGNVRQYNGTIYADRNITISSQQAPVTPVTVRFYLKTSEFLTLRNTAGSGVVLPQDIAVFHNNEFCAAEISSPALMLPTGQSAWGPDLVYTASVNSFSSFYFAAASKVLPVHLLSFTGAVKGPVNELTWKATCTGKVSYTIQRSTDGIAFEGIGTINALAPDCDLPFAFTDAAPAPGTSFYRLEIKDENDQKKYSHVVTLHRAIGSGLELQLLPNPVQGPQANVKITSDRPQLLHLQVTDAQGRLLSSSKETITAGTTNIVLKTSSFTPGVYYIRYVGEDQKSKTLKMVKL